MHPSKEVEVVIQKDGSILVHLSRDTYTPEEAEFRKAHKEEAKGLYTQWIENPTLDGTLEMMGKFGSPLCG